MRLSYAPLSVTDEPDPMPSTTESASRPLWSDALLNVVPATLLVAGAAAASARVFLLPSGYLIQVVVIFVGLGLALAPFLPQHLPLTRFGSANRVTLLRAGLVALLAGLVGQAGLTPALAWWATTLALVALAFDGLDGWLARRHGLQSAFGARFDMEVDAFLILILAMLVYQTGRTGGWILLSGVMRYGFVALGYVLPWLCQPLPPRKRRQTVCVIQTAALALGLLPVLTPLWTTALALIALGLLLWSFAVDIVWLARRAATAHST